MSFANAVDTDTGSMSSVASIIVVVRNVADVQHAVADDGGEQYCEKHAPFVGPTPSAPNFLLRLAPSCTVDVKILLEALLSILWLIPVPYTSYGYRRKTGKYRTP